MEKRKRLVLTSYGLTTVTGRKLISKEISKDGNLGDKRIFLFHEPYYSAEPMLIKACLTMKLKKENIILSGQQKSNDELLEMDYIYVGEGNAFEILSLLRERGLDTTIRKAVKNGATYIGASAGAMIGGISIEEAFSFDRNYVGMNNFEGLCLFDGIVLPHYTNSELKRYISNSPGIEERYNKIFSVANDGILVLDEH